MNSGELRDLTQQAFAADKIPRKRDIVVANLATLLISPSAIMLGLEHLARADLKTQLLTLGVYALGVGTLAKTWDDYDAISEISDGLKVRQEYDRFIQSYVIEDMIPRFVHDFSADDPDIGITIYGTSERIFHMLLAAEVLDKAAEYQADRYDGDELKEPRRTVREVLEVEEMPKRNRDLAQQLRTEAIKLDDQMDPTQREIDRNWTFDQMEDAAKEIGEILAQQIDYEIQHAFAIYEENLNPSIGMKIILGRHSRRQRARQMQELLANEVGPDLDERRSTLAYRIHRIGNNHRDQHKPPRP